MRLPTLLLPFLLPWAAACGDGGEASPLDTPLLVAVEEVRYGEEWDRAEELVEPAGVMPLPGGGIVVSEPGRGWLLEFGPEGDFRRFWSGAEADPPLRAPGHLGRVGDTLAVTDAGRGIGLFGRDGDWAGLVSFARTPSSEPFPLHPAVLLADGTVGAAASVPDGLVAEGAVTHALWVRTRRTGEVLDTLVRLDARGRAAVVEVRGRRGLLGHPVPFAPLWIPVPDGSSFLLVDRLPVMREEGSAVLVHRVGLDGDTLATAVLPYEPVPLDEARRDSVAQAVARERSPGSGLSEAEMAAALLEQLRWPPHLPAVTAAVPSGDGGLWLRYRESGDRVRWEWLDADLEPGGHVLLPGEVRLVAARDSWLWGVLPGDGGARRVVRYTVGPGS